MIDIVKRICPLNSTAVIIPVVDKITGRIIEYRPDFAGVDCLREGCRFYVLSEKVCLLWHLYNLIVCIGKESADISDKLEKIVKEKNDG